MLWAAHRGSFAQYRTLDRIIAVAANLLVTVRRARDDVTTIQQTENRIETA